MFCQSSYGFACAKPYEEHAMTPAIAAAATAIGLQPRSAALLMRNSWVLVLDGEPEANRARPQRNYDADAWNIERMVAGKGRLRPRVGQIVHEQRVLELVRVDVCVELHRAKARTVVVGIRGVEGSKDLARVLIVKRDAGRIRRAQRHGIVRCAVYGPARGVLQRITGFACDSRQTDSRQLRLVVTDASRQCEPREHAARHLEFRPAALGRAKIAQERVAAGQ